MGALNLHDSGLSHPASPRIRYAAISFSPPPRLSGFPSDVSVSVGLMAGMSQTPSVFVIDRPLPGIVHMEGTDAADLLQRITTNELRGMKPGDARPSVFATDKGRIFDHVHVLATDRGMTLMTSPGRADDVRSWIDKYTIMEDVRSIVCTDYVAMFSVIGDNAVTAAGMVGIGPGPDTGFTGFAYAMDEFGTMGVHVVVAAGDAEALRSRIVSASASQGNPLIEGDRFNAWRISTGIPAWPGELNGSFNPYEAGLRHAISFSKGCYIGQEVIARLDTYQKIQRQLVGLTAGADLPITGVPIELFVNDEPAGWLTSAVRVNGRTIGLGIIRKAIGPGGRLEAGPGGPSVTVVDFPIGL